MGKRLENWLSKASATETRRAWKSRWLKFSSWVVTEENPLTGEPYLSCEADGVDDKIREDFENLPSHLFQDKWRDILTKYVTFLDKSKVKPNTASSWIASVRSFFSNEAASIKLQKGKLPKPEMAMGEHRFTLNEFRKMWHVANLEGKARLSTAISLGWSVGDFSGLRAQFIREVLSNLDDEGYCSFDYRRGKTKARVRGILNPCAVRDLKNYLKRVPNNQEHLWNAKSKEGLNYWIKSLCNQADIKENGTIRFHLIRKYVFDIVSSRCGVYEAKLLVGKNIPLSDETYLHSLQDRLLERYQKFAYPFFKLDGREEQEAKIPEKVQQEVEELKTTVKTMSQTIQQQDEETKQLRQEQAILKRQNAKFQKLWTLAFHSIVEHIYLVEQLAAERGVSVEEVLGLTEKQKANWKRMMTADQQELEAWIVELDTTIKQRFGVDLSQLEKETPKEFAEETAS